MYKMLQEFKVLKHLSCTEHCFGHKRIEGRQKSRKMYRDATVVLFVYLFSAGNTDNPHVILLFEA